MKRANENLAERDLPPLPAKITTHCLRRMLATLFYGLGESPLVVMTGMGQTSPVAA